MQLDVRRLARLADPGDVGLARHERVHPADEQLGVLDREPELERGDLRRRPATRSRGARRTRPRSASCVELRARANCADRVLHRATRTRPERAEQRLAQLRVHRRVEHRERGHRPADGGVGRTVVVAQQRLRGGTPGPRRSRSARGR